MSAGPDAGAAAVTLWEWVAFGFVVLCGLGAAGFFLAALVLLASRVLEELL